MKKRKWLLITVLIIFVINISFFVLVRSSVMNNRVQELVAKYVKQNLQAEIDFGNFSFNDKQLKISKLTLAQNETYSLQVDQIYVEYNLLQLLFSKFKDLHSIKYIKIYEPELSLRLRPTESKVKKALKIPDLSLYFQNLELFDGKLEIEYCSDAFSVKKKFRNLNLTVRNTKKTAIELNARGSKQDTIFAKVVFKTGELIKSTVDISALEPDSLAISGIQPYSADLDLKLAFQTDSLFYAGDISNLKLEAQNKELSAEKLMFYGDEDQIDFSFQNLFVDGIGIFADISVFDFLHDTRSISAELNSYGMPLSHYLPEVKGVVDLNATIVGQLTNPAVEAELSSESIIFANQKLEKIHVLAGYQNNKLKWDLLEAHWQDNLLTGKGSYPFSGKLLFDLEAKDFDWQNGALRGDIIANITFDKSLQVQLNSNHLDCQYASFNLENSTLIANLDGTEFTADLFSSSKDIHLNAWGDLSGKKIHSSLILKHLELSKYLSQTALPLVSGSIEADYENEKLNVHSTLNAYDRDFGKLNGRFSTDVVLDFENKLSSLQLNTYNAKYNYEPLNLSLAAEGNFDSLSIEKFTFNQDISCNGWLKIDPQFTYDLQISGQKIKLRNLARYFTDYTFYNELQGDTSFDLHTSNIGAGNIAGNLLINGFSMGEMRDFDASVHLAGDYTDLNLYDSYLSCENQKLIDISSKISLKPELQVEATGMIDDVDLENLFISSDLGGKIKGNLKYVRHGKKQHLDAEIESKDIRHKKFKIDEAVLSVSQYDSLLVVHDLHLKRNGLFHLSSQGSIGFNVLNNAHYSSSHTIDINFEGDILAILASNVSGIKYGESQCDFLFKFGILEGGLFLKEGNFNLKKGSLIIQDQPEPVDKIQVAMSVENNRLDVEQFSFRMGEGKAYISNEFTSTDQDFKLGPLNLGRFLLRTSENGLLVYIPGYNPKNSYINAIVTGRDSDYMQINGPFDDLLIKGDLIFFNGDLVYPPNTENLLRLLNKVTIEKKTDKEPLILPLSLDVKMKIGENVRYVTYPVDVHVKQDGYIHLRYINGAFQPTDGDLSSIDGAIDIFGTTLTLDYLNIELNQFRKGAVINGTFYKKTSDGTLITLDIFNDETVNTGLGHLRFQLNSDDADDTTTDILAKLRYNRSMDEISPAQKQSILQDEVIQIAGLGLESALLDPLISPIENSIRKFLKLDYFHLQIDIIQNLFSNYSSEQKSELTYNENETEVNKFTSELFLNNLNLSAGKYLSRKLFFDYELSLEKEENIVTKSYLGVYHDFILRYDLPWKFQVSYQYSIVPFGEKNEHQIGLEKTFRFW